VKLKYLFIVYMQQRIVKGIKTTTKVDNPSLLATFFLSYNWLDAFSKICVRKFSCARQITNGKKCKQIFTFDHLSATNFNKIFKISMTIM